MKAYVYKTWDCKNCPVKTSNSIFGRAHSKVPGHNVVVTEWTPIKESA